MITVHDGIFPSLCLSVMLGLAACTTQPAVSPDALQPLPLPPDTLELEVLPVPATDVDAAPMIYSTGQAGPGVLPGVTERGLPSPERGHFELRLQERQKRVHLGLDEPQKEQQPVSNIIDFDF